MRILNVILLLLAGVVYLASLAVVSDMLGSDAAGNGMAQAFAVLLSIGEWILLGIVLAIGVARNLGAPLVRTAVLLLFPACAVANFVAVGLLTDRFYRAQWPLVVPVLMPLLFVVLTVWMQSSAWQERISSGAIATLLAALLGLAVAPWPVQIYRSRYGDRDRARAIAEWKAAEPRRLAEEQRKAGAAFEKLNQNSPLEDWLAFAAPGNELRARALEGIRRLERRQSDAEAMLQRGRNWIVRDFPEFGLQATPELCEGTRRCLRELIVEMRPNPNNRGPIHFTDAARIQEYKAGMEWAVAHGCRFDAELSQLTTTTRLYRDTPERAKFLDFVARLGRAR